MEADGKAAMGQQSITLTQHKIVQKSTWKKYKKSSCNKSMSVVSLNSCRFSSLVESLKRSDWIYILDINM